MSYYTVEFKPKAIKQLRKLPSSVIKKVAEQIGRLASTPYPNGCKKLRGAESAYRIRIGAYRVVYSIYDQQLIIQVIKIGHRKDVYK